MERLVNRRLVHHLETEGRLDHRQHAFRAGHGTGSYLAALGQILDEALERGDHIEVASLDLAKAYNRAWMPGVMQQLADWGVTGHCLHFIKHYLTNRTFQVAIGNHLSKPTREETGVPQGSVIAVTLFLVAMNGVFNILPAGVYILVYADDILLLVTGKHPKATRRKLQAAVTAVAGWADKNGFELAAKKCARLHICEHRHTPPSAQLKVKGVPIPNQKTLEVLGITLDRTLSFRNHFGKVKDRCKTRLNLLRAISGKRTRSDRQSRLRVADAIITSRIFYGVEITCRATEQLLNTLGPVYNGAIRTISGLLPSTPALAACAEIGALPFQHKLTLTISCRAVGYLQSTIDDGSVGFLGNQANRALTDMAIPRLPRWLVSTGSALEAGRQRSQWWT